MARLGVLVLAALLLGGVSSARAADGAAAGATPAGFSSVAGRTLSSVRWIVDAPVPVSRLEAETGWRAGAALDLARWQRLADGVARAVSVSGYLAPRIERLSFDEDGSRLVATVTVAAGARCVLGRVELTGLSPADSARARLWLGLSAGETWSEGRLSAGISRLVDGLVQSGHPFAQARVRRLGVDQGRADLEIAVLEGDSALVDSVLLDGPHRTRPTVVARATGGLAGAPYDPRRAAEARTRLVNLGTFSSVGAPRFEFSSPGRGLLRYDVAEGQQSSFDGVLGYQGEGHSLAGTAHLLLENIAGTARRAELLWRGRGQGNADFQLAYREPFLFGLPVGAGLTFAQELADSEYTRTDYGASAELPAGEGFSLELGLGGTRVVTEHEAVRRSTRQKTWGTIRRATDGWRAEGASGRRTAARLELTTTQEFIRDYLPLGASVRDNLTSLAAESEIAAPLAANRLVRFGVAGGLKLGSGHDLATYDLYPLGGAETLRGYREREFLASRFALLRAEHGWRVGGGDLFLFLDQALLDRPAADSTGGSQTRYRAGYGFGAWLPTSVGRAGVSVGWGQGDGPLEAKVHLSLRSRF